MKRLTAVLICAFLGCSREGEQNLRSGSGTIAESAESLKIRGGILAESSTGVVYIAKVDEFESDDGERLYTILKSCTGSIISSQEVLTAAHCVSGNDQFSLDTDPASYRVAYRTAAADTAPRTEEDPDSVQFEDFLPVAAIEQHPQYISTRNPEYDVAKITTAASFPGSLTRMTMDVTTNPRTIPEGTAMTVIGYGQIGTGVSSSGDRLKGTSLILSASGYGPTLDDLIHSGPSSKNQIVCKGDSGGPGIRDGKIIGIAYGIDDINCSSTKRAFHASLYFNREWLIDAFHLTVTPPTPAPPATPIPRTYTINVTGLKPTSAEVTVTREIPDSSETMTLNYFLGKKTQSVTFTFAATTTTAKVSLQKLKRNKMYRLLLPNTKGPQVTAVFMTPRK